MKKKDQVAFIRSAKSALDMNNKELAEALGKSEAALEQWQASAGTARRRTMPAGSRMLLERILKEHQAKK